MEANLALFGRIAFAAPMLVFGVMHLAKADMMANNVLKNRAGSKPLV